MIAIHRQLSELKYIQSLKKTIRIYEDNHYKTHM